ncbi:GAG-POL [Melia azedarach]|uniref:GAG-POL n=1 Tax=Melia azedarach TaxID=155640 RepID=A0ACC1XBK0_MELAZ|nr:GAG-POL [Melia azedarach]
MDDPTSAEIPSPSVEAVDMSLPIIPDIAEISTPLPPADTDQIATTFPTPRGLKKIRGVVSPDDTQDIQVYADRGTNAHVTDLPHLDDHARFRHVYQRMTSRLSAYANPIRQRLGIFTKVGSEVSRDNEANRNDEVRKVSSNLARYQRGVKVAPSVGNQNERSRYNLCTRQRSQMLNSEAPRGFRREVTLEPGQSSRPPSALPQDEYAESQNVRALDLGPSKKGKGKAATSRDLETEKAKEEEMRELRSSKGEASSPDILGDFTAPLADSVKNTTLPGRFKMPQLDPYHGQSDLVAHAEIFQNLMLVQGVPDEIMCKVFPTTLSGPARTWYKKLPSGSIRDFTTFANKFVLYFQGAKPPIKDLSFLQYIKQRGQEPLHEYVKRYHDEVMQMRVYEEPKILRNFWYNLYTGLLWMSFEERPSTSYREAYDRAMKQIAIEEKCNIKREREKAEDFSDKGKDKKKQDVRPSRLVPP